MRLRKLSALIALVLVVTNIQAQINVNTNTNAANLASRLIGSGVNVTNATLNCPPLASGDFTDTASNLGLDSGIVLTSGTADSTSLPQGLMVRPTSFYR